MPYSKSSMRYKVDLVQYPVGANATDRKAMNLITDNGYPAVDINRHLILAQVDRERPITTNIYYLCNYLNYLNEHHIEPADATMVTITDFLCELYCDGLPYSGNGDPKSYSAICDFVEVIAKLYDSLILRGYDVDVSLFTKTQQMLLAPDPKTSRHRGKVYRGKEHLTMIPFLIRLFNPNQNDVPQMAYTKWYSAEEITAIAAALPLVYRCIFLDTVYTGHRIDSALSLTLDSVDLYEGTVTPTRSKTGKIHTSIMPPSLVENFRQYLIDVRSDLRTESDYFFIGKNGEPVSYAAYRHALEAARVKVNREYGWEIQALHTHAGRSTFAAALRSYQLDCQRKGIPTFSDTDFCNLMDWKSLASLEHYDLVTRVRDVSPLLIRFYGDFSLVLNENHELVKNNGYE